LEETAGFVVPACEGCGGRLKPHVVFFGENVPKDRVLRVTEAVERSDAVLVVGSSLTVMSGFRFARQAFRQGTPLVIVNRGQTRADDLASVKVEAGCSEFLQELARERGQGRERTQTVGSSPASREAASAESAVSTSVTT
jgi:NAD-dependent SIR2 family protein deacetylase